MIASSRGMRLIRVSLPRSFSSWSDITMAPPDGILGLTTAYNVFLLINSHKRNNKL